MLSFLLYKIGTLVVLLCPTRISYKIAGFIAIIKYLFAFREKQEMLENLRLVLPAEGEAVLKRYSREIFINFSKYLVDFFRFKKIDAAYIKRHVEVIHRDYLDGALAKGKGAIILSAHFGSWELGGATMGILGYRINVLVLDHKNRRVNDFFVNQRRIKNENVISATFGLRKCFSALTNNEFLAIVGDKDFTNSGVLVKFFGKDALLPKGAAVLSLKTGAAIIPGFVIRDKEDNFRLVFERPIEYSPGEEFDKDVSRLIESYVRVIEEVIRRYPTQWYCFRRFWQ